jgi:hypothetical protein
VFWLHMYVLHLNGLESHASIDLRLNEISGSIPSTIGYMTELTLFNVSSNRMTGTLPTGTIPSSIGNLTDWTLLYIMNNCLSGSIPSVQNKIE